MPTPQAMLDAEKAAEEQFRQMLNPTDATNADPPPASETQPTPAPVDESPAPPSTPPEDEGADHWQHKYDVLKGKYDTEIRRALDESAYWRDRAAQLVAARQPEPVASTSPAPTNPLGDATSLVDYLGEDGAKAIHEWMAKKQAEMESRVAEMAQAAHQSSEQTFWSQVRQAFPDYASMEHDPVLNQWLSESWPGAQQTRLDQARELARNCNAAGFIALLRAYAPPAPTPTAAPLAKPAPTPRRAAGTGTPPPEKPSYSPAQIVEMGERVRRLNLEGRRKEASDLEREIDTAMRESRIGIP